MDQPQIDVDEEPLIPGSSDLGLLILSQENSLAYSVAGVEGEILTEAAEDAVFDRITDPSAHSTRRKVSLSL